MSMKPNIKRYLVSLLLLVPLFTTAQVMPLDSVLQRIGQANPMLKEYEARAAALQAYAEGATAWMAPMAGAGPYWYPYPGQMRTEGRDKGMFMVNLEQDIPNPAKQKAKQRYYDARARVEHAGQDTQYNTLKAEARSLYYQWYVSTLRLRLTADNRRMIEAMLNLARLRYPYNQSSLGTIYRTEGRLYEVENMRLMTEGNINRYRTGLLALMNLHPQTPIAIDTALQRQLLVYDSGWVTRRDDLRQIEETVQVMQLNQDLQRLQRKPDFRVRFEHMQPRDGMMPKQFSAMAMISIPIAPWSSRMYRSEVKGMSHDIEAMRWEQASIRREAENMVAGMAAQLISLQQQLDNYDQKILPALRRNYDAVMLAYAENREQLPAVLAAWEALNMSRMDYLKTLEDYFNMRAQYEKETYQ